MSLLQTLTGDMKEAMKNRQKERLQTTRLLLSELKNMIKDKKRDLKEDEEFAFLSGQAKRRRDSIEAFEQAQRDELAEKERQELNLIHSYLPPQLDEAGALEMLKGIIEEVGATSTKDFGKVMKVAAPKLKGIFPGKQVPGLVKQLLS